MKKCGLSRRLAAIFYDTLLLTAVLFLATVIVLPLTGGEAIESGNPFYFFYLLGCCYLYFCWQWVNGGQTLGMRAWKIRLLDSHGMNISWRLASQRFMLALLSWLALGAGFIWAIFDTEKAALHDRFSHSVMVVEKSGNPPDNPL